MPRADSPYNHRHVAKRKALLPYAIGKPCPLCDQVMLASDDLDLDHTVPVSLDSSSVGDRITHASCNRSRGNGLTSKPKPRTSRRW